MRTDDRPDSDGAASDGAPSDGTASDDTASDDTVPDGATPVGSVPRGRIGGEDALRDGPHRTDDSVDARGDNLLPIDEWYGMMIVDSEGFRIGKLHDVYMDPSTREPQFAMVRGGFLDRRVTLVPLRGVRIGNDRLEVAVTKAEIGSEPDFDQLGDALELPEQAALYRHFRKYFAPVSAFLARPLTSHWGQAEPGDGHGQLDVDGPDGMAG